MAGTTGRLRHLTFDSLTVNHKVARRLPYALACRYHALPVAEADGRITMAMAHPDDMAAREAISTILGSPSCVVGCEQATLEALLAEVWPEMLQRPPRILICGLNYAAGDEISEFAEQVAGLFHGRVDRLSPSEADTADCDIIPSLDNQKDSDLVIWGEPEQSFAQQLLASSACYKAVKSITPSLLVIRRPRWPLRRLLLIVSGEETDDAAAGWLVRLARPSGAAITVLAVVPPVAAMVERFGRLRQGLDALLTTDTDLGQRLRRLTEWLVEWEMEGTLRLRQGTPGEQIRREIDEGDYDLVAVGAAAGSRAKGWLEVDCVRSVLRWADRPLLIAKPSGAPGPLTS